MVEKNTVITVQKDFDLPGMGITLEKGDKIKVLKESARHNQLYDLIDNVFYENYEELVRAIVDAMPDHEFNEIYEYLKRIHQ